jgi:hypothetical protein
MSSSFKDFRCMSTVHSILSLHASQGPTKKEGGNDGSYRMWNPRRWKFLVVAKYKSVTTYAVCVLDSPVNFSYYCSPLPVGCQYWSEAPSGARPKITWNKSVWITLSGWWYEVTFQEPYIQNNDDISEGSIFKFFSRKFPNRKHWVSWNFNGLNHKKMSAISCFEISFKQKWSAQIPGAGS